MAINVSGIRDTGRVLGISLTTVINEFKKAGRYRSCQLSITRADSRCRLYQVESAEMDEMWSFVGSKKQQRWLWHVIDHTSGDVLAYVGVATGYVVRFVSEKLVRKG